MNLLNIEHISKIYGEKIIFDDASFGVQEGDKICEKTAESKKS